MLSKSELWETFEPLVTAEGLALYDLDLPAGLNGVLRVYISRPSQAPVEEGPSQAQGVGVEDCARVSRKLSEWIENQGVEVLNTTLEVSSPGINRKLSRTEHFASAVGERVKLKLRVRSVEQRRAGPRVIVGRLTDFDGSRLQVAEEGGDSRATIDLEEIQEARIDFLFDR
jgi:ribosome maturation factor RimP